MTYDKIYEWILLIEDHLLWIHRFSLDKYFFYYVQERNIWIEQLSKNISLIIWYWIVLRKVYRYRNERSYGTWWFAETRQYFILFISYGQDRVKKIRGWLRSNERNNNIWLCMPNNHHHNHNYYYHYNNNNNNNHDDFYTNHHHTFTPFNPHCNLLSVLLILIFDFEFE